MSKDKFTDYSATASSNTDVGGISIQTGCDFGNVDDALREILSHIAEANAGTHPVSDTWTFGDPADLTKRYRFDAGSVTAGQTRVITVPDRTGTMVLADGAQTLISKSFADASDATKILTFDFSGITTATTRTVTWPDSTGTVLLTSTFDAAKPTLATIEALSLVAGDTLYATAADTIARLPKGTADQVLTMNAGATAPEWQTPDAIPSVDYGAGIAALTAGAIGTHIIGGRVSANVTASVGTTYSGADVRNTGGSGGISGSTMSGTWRCLSPSNTNISGEVENAGLFLRIS